MKSAMTILVVLALVVSAGCTSTSVDNSAQTPRAQSTAPVPPPQSPYVGPAATQPSSTFVQGKVFRVWPFENGKLMAYLGAEDGIRAGDRLALLRGGVMINTVEVVDVEQDILTGRVVDRKDEGAQAKEGDIVMRVPPTSR